MGRDCASETVPITLAEADQRTTSGRKASAEIDVAAVTVEGIPLAELAHGPQTVKDGRLDRRATEARTRAASSR